MASAASALAPAISNGEVILIVVFLAIPVAAIAFMAGAGTAFRQIGKDGLSLELESDMPKPLTDSEAASSAVREEEIRQLVEAKAYRQRSRGERPVDVDEEVSRLLAEQGQAAGGVDAELREEVRQLVVARNARRQRQGKDPLDVDAEVDRQLRELDNLGQ